MTWVQNERSYRPNLWKRMSFHVKKKEAVEVNQTAIIKPFSKDGDASVDAGIKDPYEETQEPFTYSPARSPLPTVSQQAAAKAVGLQGEEDSEESQALPAYVPEHLAGVRRRGGEGNPGVADSADLGMMDVGDIGIGVLGGQPQGATIMDQISCVVNRFTANISELNTMMLPGGVAVGAVPGAAAPPAATATAADIPNPPCPPPYPAPRLRPNPSTVTTYAEVAPIANYCENRPVGKIYEQLAGTCMGARRTREEDELVALTPPSPFRDSSLSSEGSSSPASEAEYDQLLLKHYSQSSSSL